MPGILRSQRNEFMREADNNDDDDDQSTEGDSRSVTELGSDEFPSYFIERGARLFSSNQTPYLLPVDAREQEV